MADDFIWPDEEQEDIDNIWRQDNFVWADDLAETYGAMSGYSPDVAAHARQMVDSGVDPVTAMGAADSFKALAPASQPPNFQKLVADSPTTSQFLSKPSNMALAHDEIEQLGFFERKVRQAIFGWERGKTQLELARVGWDRLNGGDTPENEERARKLEWQLQNNYRAQPKGLFGGLHDKAIGAATEMMPVMLSAFTEGAKGAMAASTAFAAAAAIGGQLGPQAALPEELVTVPGAWAAGLTFGSVFGGASEMYRVASGLTYNTIRSFEDADGNKISHDVAAGFAVAEGLLEAGLEMVSFGGALKSIPGIDRIFRGAIRQAAVKGARGLAGNAVKYVAAETGQEVAQEFVAIMAEEGAKALENELTGSGFELVSSMEAWDRLVDTAAQSAMAFTVLGTPGYGMRTYGMVRDYAKTIKTASDAMAGTKLPARFGPAAEELMGDIISDLGIGETAFIPAVELDVLFQTDETRQEFLDAAGIERADYVEAVNLGSHVPVDLRRLPRLFNNEAWKTALDQGYIKQHPEDPAVSPLKEEKPAAAKPVTTEAEKREAEKRFDERQSLTQTLAQRFQDAGFGKEQATGLASMAVARAQVVKEQIGTDPKEYIDNWFRNIRQTTFEKFRKETGIRLVPPKPKPEAKTIGQEIARMGGVKFGGQLFKETTPEQRRVMNNKKGVSYDVLEMELKSNGWMSEDEDIRDLFQNPDFLKRRHLSVSIEDVPLSELTDSERKILASMEYEVTDKPAGNWEDVDVSRLPEGERIPLFTGQGNDGWDFFTVKHGDDEVIISPENPYDNFGATGPITLKYGEMIHARVNDADVVYQRGKKQAVPRGATVFDYRRYPAITRFFKGANFSTGVHEMAHVFLRDLQEVAANPAAPEQVRKDLAEVRKALGLADGAKFETIHEEDFARAWEKYIASGKAPSVSLKAMFERFAQWMIKVYRSVTSIPGGLEITPEIRAVFDRMIATEREIADAKATIGLDNLFDESDVTDGAMTAKELEQYREKLVAAGQSISDIIRVNRGTEVDARLEALRPDAEAAAKDNKDVVLLADLVKAGGFDEGWLKQNFDKDIVSALKKKQRGLVRKKGSLPPESSTVRAALNARTFQEVTDEILARERGRLLEESLAPDFEYSAEYADLLETERNVLRRISNRKQGDHFIEVTNRLAEVKAERISLAELKRQKIELRAAVRAAKEETAQKFRESNRVDRERAADRVAETKTRAALSVEESKVASEERLQAERVKRADAALKAKERQIAAVAKVRAENQARNDFKGIVDTLKKASGNKSMPMNYQEQIQNLLASFGLTEVRPIYYEGMPSLEAFLDSKHEDVGGADNLAAWLFDPVEVQRRIEPKTAPYTTKAGKVVTPRAGYRHLALQDMRDIKDAVDFLQHLGRTDKILLAQENQLELGLAALEVVTSINSNGKALKEASNTLHPDFRKRPLEKTKEKVSAFMASLLKAETIFRAADGWQEGGATQKLIYEQLVNAENAELILWEETGKKLQSMFAVYRGKLREMATKEIMIPGFEKVFNREHIVCVGLNSGNVGNRQALEKGWGWTPEQVDEILGYLTPQDWEFIKGVWSAMDELWPRLDGVKFKLTGIHGKKVIGNYYPLVWDTSKSDKAAQFAINDNSVSMENEYTRPNVNSRFMKERQGGKLPVLLSFDVIPRHFTASIHYATHALALRDAFRLIKEEPVAQAFKAQIGEERYAQLVPWLQGIARPDGKMLEGFDHVAAFLRKNATVAMLGLKITTGLKQPLAFINAIHAVGLKTATKALVSFAVHPRETYAFVRENSPSFRARYKAWDRDVQTTLSAVDLSEWGFHIGNHFVSATEMRSAAFAYIRILDTVTAGAVWFAGYLKVKDEMPHKDAVSYADGVMRRTQGSAMAKDLAAIQRGSETQKLFTMFYTYSNAYYQLLLENNEAFASKKIPFTKFFMGYVWLLFVPAILEQAIVGNLPDEPEDVLREYGDYLVQGIPYVRDVGRFWFDRNKGYGRNFKMTPVEGGAETGDRMISSFWTIWEKTYGSKEWETVKGKDVYNAVRATIDGSGYFLGMPSKQMIQWMDAGINAYDEGVTFDSIKQFLIPPPYEPGKKKKEMI